MSKYQVEDQMFNDFKEVLSKYAGKISVVTTLGVLELLKADVLDQLDDTEEEENQS